MQQQSVPQFPANRDRITLAILALGGEGGGVLADWILGLANRNGYVAQGTSVPGVAQRTGATVYYIEMVKRVAEGENHPDPVLAMMPMPGDVDIVIASELMETGRAIIRGFVSEDRTTLIGSTHRVYAISEKSALGDGTSAGQNVLEAARRRAARYIGFDMAAAATSSGSVISSVLFGALAGSYALPFPTAAFEEAVRESGKAVQANLNGFRLGLERAQTGDPQPTPASASSEPTTAAGRELKARIERELPQPVHAFAIEGAKHLMDYQDKAYAQLYLSRVADIKSGDDGAENWQLTREAARHIALWMAYDDTIRVADLKIRASRSIRVETEVRVTPDQVLSVTEYMHPRLREVCETLPAGIGAFILASPMLQRWLKPWFAKGRQVKTTSLRWFLALWMLSKLRGMRRSTLRYREEQRRIEEWLTFVSETGKQDTAAATEILACQQLIKGYSDTFERGLANFLTVMQAAQAAVGQYDAATRIRRLRDAALADEDGNALSCAIGASATTT